MGTDKNIKLHIVTDIKEIIKNILTSFKNCHMMLKLFIILVVPIAVSSSAIYNGYKCIFDPGDGRGNDELYLEGIKEVEHCAKACIDLKKYWKAINGATIQKCSGCSNKKAYCWCEIGMSYIAKSSKYESCFMRA